MRTIKILTLNIHKGFSMGNRRFTLDRIRDSLRGTGSHVVFLQEVVGDGGRPAGGREGSQFEYLADAVWDHYAYGRNAIHQRGHHGNAILSETPFASARNVDVTAMGFSRRGVLHGVLENGIHLLCAHLGLFERERRRQVARLARHIAENVPPDAPLILAGDFNDWRRTAHRLLKARLGLVEACEHVRRRVALTYPAAAPVLPMDRIYLRGLRPRDIRVMSGGEWRWLSDHRALAASVTPDGAD